LNESIRTLTDENWEAEVLKADSPVLVDFWATWCPPCRMIAPLIDELGRDYAGRVKVGKLDVDRYPDVAGRYGIVSIPTLLVFRNGEVVDQSVGARPREALRALLDTHVAEGAPAAS